MRLIDADALLEKLPIVEKDEQISLIGAVADMVVLISNAPTIDAVPVVRCKDCKHWGTDWALGETEYVKCCEFGQYMVGANGYCVYGEVKNND